MAQQIDDLHALVTQLISVVGQLVDRITTLEAQIAAEPPLCPDDAALLATDCAAVATAINLGNSKVT